MATRLTSWLNRREEITTEPQRKRSELDLAFNRPLVEDYPEKESTESELKLINSQTILVEIQSETLPCAILLYPLFVCLSLFN